MFTFTFFTFKGNSITAYKIYTSTNRLQTVALHSSAVIDVFYSTSRVAIAHAIDVTARRAVSITHY